MDLGLSGGAQMPLILALALASWFHHDKKTPLVIPAPAFSSTEDPRDGALRNYLDQKRVDLAKDRVRYPALRAQIDALLIDIQALEGTPVADPAYHEHFTQFHASLTALYALEGYDAI
jgi:hypothetical protein